MKDDSILVEFLIQLKHGVITKSQPVPFTWGNKQPRSRSRLTASVSRCDRAFSTRCSPTTPLSWSGGASPSLTADGYEDSSRYQNHHAVRSKVRFIFVFATIYMNLCSPLFLHRSLHLKSVSVFWPKNLRTPRNSALEWRCSGGCNGFVRVWHYRFWTKFHFVSTVLPSISLFTHQRPFAFLVLQSRISFSIFRWHRMLTENKSQFWHFYFLHIFKRKKILHSLKPKPFNFDAFHFFFFFFLLFLWSSILCYD